MSEKTIRQDEQRSGVRLETVAGEDAGIRLDRWFRRRCPALPHVRLEKLLRTGQIRVDGKRAKAGERLSEGQTVRIPPLDEAGHGGSGRERGKTMRIRPEDFAAIRASVLHIDDAVIVLNKPPGLATQGGTNTRLHVDGLLDALCYEREDRPRLVHRLDKETSGVLVLGRTAAAAAALARSFLTHKIDKVYWALVKGVPKPPCGTVEAALAKMAGSGGEKMAVVEDGRKALTDYRVVDAAGAKASWLCLRPRTGRTHQLRVHCLSLGTPILGDGKYGGAEAFLGADAVANKLHLHARAVALPHPDGGTMRVVAPLPPHMAESFAFLGFDEKQEADPFAGPRGG